MESYKIRRRGRLSSSIVAVASWSVLFALLLSLVVLDVSLPSVSLSFLSLGVAGSDKLVFQGEELGGTALGRGGEMGELESAGGRGEEVGGRELGGGSGSALPLTCTARSAVTSSVLIRQPCRCLC